MRCNSQVWWSVCSCCRVHPQNVSTRKNLSQYNITNTRGKVVRFCIYKTSFRLGEDIVATFDFSEAEIPCVQVGWSSYDAVHS